MKRLFVAINLPEALKEKIFETLSKEIDPKKLKVVKKENLHLTLAFLGYFPEEKIQELEEKLSGVKELQEFEIELTGIGCFKNRVLWLGMEKGKQEAIELNKKVNELLGLESERFSAHLTLARNKEFSGKELNELIKKLEEKRFSATTKINSVELMESKLTPNGPIYSVVKKFELGLL